METELSKSLSLIKLSDPDECIHEDNYKVCHPGNSPLLHTWPLSTWRFIEGRVQYKLGPLNIKGWGLN